MSWATAPAASIPHAALDNSAHFTSLFMSISTPV